VIVHRYVVSVRETVDTQYVVSVPNELSDEAQEALLLSDGLAQLLLSGWAGEAHGARNVRGREVVDVTAIPPVEVEA